MRIVGACMRCGGLKRVLLRQSWFKSPISSRRVMVGDADYRAASISSWGEIHFVFLIESQVLIFKPSTLDRHFAAPQTYI